jgi:hypothetical protein
MLRLVFGQHIWLPPYRPQYTDLVRRPKRPEQRRAFYPDDPPDGLPSCADSPRCLGRIAVRVACMPSRSVANTAKYIGFLSIGQENMGYALLRNEDRSTD